MLVSAIEGHRIWAPQYDGGLNPILALESRLLENLCGVRPSGLPPGFRPAQEASATAEERRAEARAQRAPNPTSTIDVGCGTGRWTERLGGFGVDLSPEMLREASRKPALRGRLLLADAAALPFASGISDLTLCSFAVGYIHDLPAAIAEMARVTRPGGRIVVTDLHPAAIAAGWTRSFRAGGTVYEMEHSAAAVEETLEAARRCGLRLERERSACLGEPEKPILEAAGKAAAFDELARTPAVWIGLWSKP